MSIKDKVEIALWICQSIFYAGSAIAIFFGFFKYATSVRQRTAETLVELEDRFAGFKDIARLVDPASGRYEDELSPAVEKSLDEAQPKKSEPEEKAIARLDEFLRFLLLLGSLEKNRLLNKEALAYMYHYWFAAILTTPNLKTYVATYFKRLDRFLEDNRPTFLKEFSPQA